MTRCKKCDTVFADGNICPVCGKKVEAIETLSKGTRILKAKGKVGAVFGAIALGWDVAKPFLKYLIPPILMLIVWAISKNGYFVIAALLGSVALFWINKGWLKTVLIVLTIFFIIIGISAVRGGIKQLWIVYGKNIGLSISNGWKTVTGGLSCTWCQATSGLMNPAACEEKCDLGIERTERLLDITYEAPGSVSEGMPIAFDVSIKLLAEDETVENMAIDLWIVNETDCIGDYCMPEEMFVCPKKAECLKIVEMPCGNGEDCECQNDLCELNEDSSEKNPIVWIYNPSCHDRSKDITLFPHMNIQYEFTAKTSHKVRVSESEAMAPTQDERISVGPVIISVSTDKDVYVLEKMLDNLQTGLKIKVTNTGNGFSYIKSVNLKQEHDSGVSSFDIIECPGFTVEQQNDEVKLSLKEEKSFRLSPRDPSTIINCIMNVPSEGITKFNEYTFSTFVNYLYKETKALAPVFLDCGQKKG